MNSSQVGGPFKGGPVGETGRQARHGRSEQHLHGQDAPPLPANAPSCGLRLALGFMATGGMLMRSDALGLRCSSVLPRWFRKSSIHAGEDEGTACTTGAFAAIGFSHTKMG